MSIMASVNLRLIHLRRSFSLLRSPRVLWFVLALLLFGIFTFIAHRQAPRPDPFQPVQTLSWDWWKYPIERNTFKRLPVIISGLNDVFALPNSKKVWAVGSDGVIVHSEDGGETWVRQKMNWQVVADSQLTQSSAVQEQQQIDPRQTLNANEKADLSAKQGPSNVAQKGFDFAKNQEDVSISKLVRTLTDRSPSLSSVHFVDANNGCTVGYHGTILVTSNGGASWQVQASGTTSSLNSVHFVNAATGWAVGDDGTILVTSNGGVSWQAQASATTISLHSVHFVNATTGWAVGGAGMILMTNNGGTTWQAQASGTESWLRSVHFVNATIGWAVGYGGTILMTSDGGATWQTQARGATSWLHSVHFMNATTGWAVGDEGAILVTSNGGTTWQAQMSGSTSPLHSVHFMNATTGWVVGDYGTILVTSNGGATWQAQARGTTSPLTSVHFANATTGWAVGAEGAILATSNGGATWQVQARGATRWLYSVHFSSATTGWAVGLGGTILVTSNGGATWQTQESGTTSPLISVHFMDATIGWVVGEDGTILVTSNGGATWQAQASGTTSLLSSVHFVNASTGWAVGDDGTILVTSNGGATWQAQTSGTRSLLRSVYFVNASTGWAVGDDGTILVTSDGGATWQAQTSGTINSLYSVHFVNATTGWIVGLYGPMLSTNDGGQTWKDSTSPYSRSFAPWYYIAWLFIAPLLYLAFKRPKPIEAEQKTVADMLVSDRPISAGDPDPLEFNAIAAGLSQFLRNENTQPPLTIAITGEWGSGKSSLMNLLKADLERYGFRPVWFNAWHHQKEEHLLAALLQNIRKQALPRWWRPEGISFRVRLFWRRVRRYRLRALLLLAFFAMAVGYFAADHPNRLHEAVQQIEHLFKGEEKLEHTILGWLQHKLAALGKTSVLALLSSIGAVLLMFWRGLRAFGVNPANLMASLSSNFKLSEVKAQMGFRHDFSREFNEVTAALNPRTMLILIDDLDRCRPENVLEVLEAVNFLVSSGDCFVVMGLDLHRVERCVGLGFKDVAEELVDQTSPATNSEKEEAKKRRADFARQYLEKLINIEVPVPKPQPEQSQSLIVPPEPAAPKPLLWWRNLLQITSPVVRKVSPWLVAATVVIAGFWFGAKQFSPQAEAPSATTVAPTTTPSPALSNQPQPSTPTTQQTQSDAPADSSRGTGELIQPQKEPTSFTFVYIVLALMLGLGIWRLSIPTDLVVKDSPEFIEALTIWHPLLIAKRNTPRAVKRFVNRVRYFAMRQSAEMEVQSLWQKLAIWAGLNQREEMKKVDAIPESTLVALSAMHHFKSDLFTRDHFRQTPESDVLLLNMIEALSPEEAVVIRTAMDEHKRKFGSWPPSEEDYEKLQKLAAGIRIN